jgi:hypothetical protein
MTAKGPSSQSPNTGADASPFSSLRLADFALLDKLLLLEGNITRATGVPGPVKARLLHQVVSLKDDIRILCMVLVGEAPARTGPVPLPAWARAESEKPQPPDGGKGSRDGG